MSFTCRRTAFWFCALAMLAAAAGLRLHTLGQRSLWMDEAREVQICGARKLSTVVAGAAQQQQPPLEYALGHLVLKCFGFSETAVRFPSFLFGTGFLFVFLMLALELFRSSDHAREMSLLACLALAFSPMQVWASQEARPYAIFLFFGALTLFFLFRALRRDRLEDWLLYQWTAFAFLMSRGMAPVIVLSGIHVAYFAVDHWAADSPLPVPC